LEKAPRRPLDDPAPIALASGRGTGSYVYDAAADRLSLRVRDVPLTDLLEAISERSGVRIKQATIAGLDRPITTSLEDVSPEQALRLLLAGFETVFFYDETGRGEDPTARLESVLVLALKNPPGAAGEARALPRPEDAAAALLQALGEDDLAAAGAIAMALLETVDPREMEQTLSGLLDTMEERPLSEYRAAVQVLAEAAPERMVAELVKRMQPPDSALGEGSVQATRRRSRAALGLGIVGDARALDPLMEVFQASEREVRIAAAESIQQIQRLQRELEAPNGASDPREQGREGLTPLRPKEQNDGQPAQRYPEPTYPEPTYPGSGPRLGK
jgi:HEAT repeat protein